MICESCQGLGFEPYETVFAKASMRMLNGEPGVFDGKVNSNQDMLWRPCPVCHGSGIAYCCEAGANPPNVWGGGNGLHNARQCKDGSWLD